MKAEDGPVISDFFMTAAEAASLNLPPDGATTDAVMEVALNRVTPLPVRALLPNEVFTKLAMGVVGVHRTDVETADARGSFTEADRALLNLLPLIAKKMGVLL